MKKINKYLYGYRIYVNYGYGYEYECYELTRLDMKNQVKCYKENCSYPVKVTRGREINPDYINHCLKSIGVDNTVLELKK